MVLSPRGAAHVLRSRAQEGFHCDRRRPRCDDRVVARPGAVAPHVRHPRGARPRSHAPGPGVPLPRPAQLAPGRSRARDQRGNQAGGARVGYRAGADRDPSARPPGAGARREPRHGTRRSPRPRPASIPTTSSFPRSGGWSLARVRPGSQATCSHCFRPASGMSSRETARTATLSATRLRRPVSASAACCSESSTRTFGSRFSPVRRCSRSRTSRYLATWKASGSSPRRLRYAVRPSSRRASRD